MTGLRSRVLRVSCAFVVFGAGWTTMCAGAQEKKVVKTDADLPRFSYALPQAPSAMLSVDDATFLPLVRKVQADIEGVLNGYSIEDKSTLRSLLSTEGSCQQLLGDLPGELATSDRIRALEDKPEAKLTAGLDAHAMSAAYADTHSSSGAAFEKSFQAHYAQEVDALPWSEVSEWARNAKQSSELVSPTLLVGAVKSRLDPIYAKTGALDGPGMDRLVYLRAVTKQIGVEKAKAPVLQAYIAAHSVTKPDIWAARDVVLTTDQKLTPVRIAIFDSGVDTSLFPGQLYVDPNPGQHGPHGLAFDPQGNLYSADLQPLTAEQKAMYPRVLQFEQGSEDLHNGLDTPDAARLKAFAASTPPEQFSAFIKASDFLSQYMHGTHVAGIAVRGNPAARLVVIQFNDGLPDLPFAPTVAWAERFKADFLQVGQYLRDHDVRVVNMSWADSQSEIEQWLNKTSTDKDPEARKQLAAQIYSVWRDAVAGAIQAAPNTLFVCAAGNSDSNASFLGDVPASLHLPNLVTVGAVDQAGDETSFTSYGDTVVLDADGYRVESYVPGGTKLKMSGTSMASPNVANLAAKLIALNPKLTPEQTLALMKQAAHASPDGRLHLIDPKATVNLLHTQQAAK